MNIEMIDQVYHKDVLVDGIKAAEISFLKMDARPILNVIVFDGNGRRNYRHFYDYEDNEVEVAKQFCIKKFEELELYK